MIKRQDDFLKLIILEDKVTKEKFNQWIEPSRVIQMRVAAFITGILYIMFSQLSKIILSAEDLSYTIIIHLYIMGPILLIIGCLSFFKNFYEKTTLLLATAAIIAALGNVYIVSNTKDYMFFLPEIYLSLFWIFTMSGLRLSYASMTAFMVFVIVFIGTFSISSISKELFLIHLFWMFSASLFGFITSFFLDRSNKIIFLNKIQLEKTAMTDELTGLFNRKKLTEVLDNELDRSKRFNHEFGFMMLDIDYFKRINDTYGHQVGDNVLKDIGRLINLYTRSTDIVIRWGGEEFVILCLETDVDGVMRLAENLRKEIEKYEFDTAGNQTISIGITMNNQDDKASKIAKRADEALYKAKNSGRNKIEII